eukprot:NODE_3719_length_337_cov_83.906250_g3048_i0.p2 GENE.NODE_3719_length_337_cov_83.906250_g3048_i0~~NODE_3719_length_337_cov_83.906250_g3048_i0.p2  ORF type:complete len:57 (+),score=8.62 NODE_3719_length_337_cov_83.906250_g3048_i0:97-267(+)
MCSVGLAQQRTVLHISFRIDPKPAPRQVGGALFFGVGRVDGGLLLILTLLMTLPHV